MAESASEFNIRRARPGEADALTALCVRSKQANGYDDAFMAACLHELTFTADDFVRREIWVAQADVLAGCAALVVQDNANARVESFFIDPDFQKMGIGLALWQTLKASAIAQAVTTLTLDSDPFAVGFYERLGFVIVDIPQPNPVLGSRLPRMQLSLTNFRD